MQQKLQGTEWQMDTEWIEWITKFKGDYKNVTHTIEIYYRRAGNIPKGEGRRRSSLGPSETMEKLHLIF